MRKEMRYAFAAVVAGSTVLASFAQSPGTAAATVTPTPGFSSADVANLHRSQLDSELAGWGSTTNKAITEQLAADSASLAKDGVSLSYWGPDPKSGKVAVHLAHYTDAARRVLLARYGNAIVVDRKSAPRFIPLDRYNDSPPFHGGDQIYDATANATCTEGPLVLGTGSGTPYMITAGHCTAGDGDRISTGNNWTEGYVANRRCAVNSIDAARVSAYWSYSYYIFGGPAGPMSSPPAYKEDGSAFPQPGDLVTSDGSQSGEITGLTVDAVNQMIRGTDCGTPIIEVTLFHGSSGCPLIQGDSGGPMMQHEGGTNSVKIVGIIAASNSSECAYTQIGAIDSAFDNYVPNT
jgi:hypothetical protein